MPLLLGRLNGRKRRQREALLLGVRKGVILGVKTSNVNSLCIWKNVDSDLGFPHAAWHVSAVRNACSERDLFNQNATYSAECCLLGRTAPRGWTSSFACWSNIALATRCLNIPMPWQSVEMQRCQRGPCARRAVTNVPAASCLIVRIVWQLDICERCLDETRFSFFVLDGMGGG